MESNHIDDSVNSNEEVDQPEQENNNVGVGRSYECVFCKRGFNTAQALGGHMNIHRKDRAKNKPSTSASSNKHEENYTGPRVYQQIPSCPPHFAASHEAQLSYRTYFPASTSSIRSLYGNHHNNSHDQNQQGLNPYEEDGRMRFSLQFCPEIVEDIGKKVHDEGYENGLDLELRLGPDP